MLTGLLLVLTAVGLRGESRIDLMSRARLRDAALTRRGVIGPAGVMTGEIPVRKSAPAPAGTVRGMVVLAEGHDISELESENVDVSAVMGNVAVVSLPEDILDHVASLDCVRSFTVDRPRSLQTARARAASNIDAIHAGTDGLPRAYDGTGVYCGIYDAGLDPNHVNFMDADGNPRIEYMVHHRVSGTGAPLSTEYTQDEIGYFATDDTTTYHGTHTLGIMAGSYRGPVTRWGEGGVAEVPNGNYGMAPGARLLAACGATSDYFIANGVADITNYALSRHRPLVLNLSLGGNSGTHDGNSAMSRFLDNVGEYAIVVMAAGNEGNIPLHVSKGFTSEDKELRSMIRCYWHPEENGNLRYGQVSLYSDDDTPFEMQAVIVNRSRGSIAYRIPLPSPGSGSASYHVSDAAYQYSSDDVISGTLAKYFNGYIGLGSAYDYDTGKFYAVLDYYTTNTESNADDNYVPGFIITGAEGHSVYAWCDASYTQIDNYGMEGWDNGTRDGSLSDMATAHNIIVVGSYNVDGTLHNLDGTEEPFEPYVGEFREGEITDFSAFAHLPDGRVLPDVCAPGVSLVSSTSRHYVSTASNNVETGRLSAWCGSDGERHWWSQTGGTSMATPVVSGAIALWLQADRLLDVDRIREIIRSTSRVDDDVTGTGEPGQWGAGKFDALAGLKEVLRGSGVNAVNGEGGCLLARRLDATSYEISLPGADSLDVGLYDVAGNRIWSLQVSSDECVMPVGSLPEGIYIVRANGRAASKIRI